MAISGAGAVATNIILTKTNAYVTDHSTLNSAGDVVLAASDTSTINATVATASAALAGGGMAGIGVSIGASLARNLIGHNLFGVRTPAQVRAYITNSNVTAAGALTQTATANETIKATVLSGSAAISGGLLGVAYSGSGVAAFNKIATEVKAYIENSVIDVGSAALSAADTSLIEADGGAAAVAVSFGGVGVSIAIGAALAENKISNEIEAYIINSGSVISRIGAI